MFFGRDEMPTFFHLMWPCGPQHTGPGQLLLSTTCQRPPTNSPSRQPTGQIGSADRKKDEEEEDSST